MTRNEIYNALTANIKRFANPGAMLEKDSNIQPYSEWESADIRILVMFLSIEKTRSVSSTDAALYFNIKKFAQSKTFIDFSYFPDPENLEIFDELKLPYIFGNVSTHPLQDYDVVFVSNSTALEQWNLSYLLLKSDIPMYSTQRDSKYPYLLLGGATADLAAGFFGYSVDGIDRSFVDGVAFGYAEGFLPQMVDTLTAVKKRGDIRNKSVVTEALYPYKNFMNPHAFEYGYAEDNFTIKSYQKVIPQQNDAPVYNLSPDLSDKYYTGWGELVRSDQYNANVDILISRGCSAGTGCYFCHENHVAGRWTERPLESIVEDMKVAKRMSLAPGVSFFSFNSVYYQCYIDMMYEAADIFAGLSVIPYRADQIAARHDYVDMNKFLGQTRVTIGVETCVSEDSIIETPDGLRKLGSFKTGDKIRIKSGYSFDWYRPHYLGADFVGSLFGLDRKFNTYEFIAVAIMFRAEDNKGRNFNLTLNSEDTMVCIQKYLQFIGISASRNRAKKGWTLSINSKPLLDVLKSVSSSIIARVGGNLNFEFLAEVIYSVLTDYRDVPKHGINHIVGFGSSRRNLVDLYCSVAKKLGVFKGIQDRTIDYSYVEVLHKRKLISLSNTPTLQPLGFYDAEVLHEGPRMVYRLETERGNMLELTQDHRVSTPNGEVMVSELVVGDEVITIAASNACLGESFYNKPGVGIEQTIPFGEMLGFLCGDGSLNLLNGNDLCYLMFSSKDAQVMEYVKLLLQGWGFSYREDNGYKDCTRIYPSAEFKHLLRKLNLTSKGAIIRTLYDTSVGFIYAFIRGLFEADGSIDESSDSITFSQSEENSVIFNGVVELLTSLGFSIKVGNVSPKENVFKYTTKSGESRSYGSLGGKRLRITGTSIQRFFDSVGFLSHRKSDRKSRNEKECIRGFDRVKAISYVGVKNCSDLRVAGAARFYANGILVHNCSDVIRNKILNKNLSEDEAVSACETLFINGTREVKLFIISTGYEEQKDFDEFIGLLKRIFEVRAKVGSNAGVRVGVTTLCHYPRTPIAWLERKASVNLWHERRTFSYLYDQLKLNNLNVRVKFNAKHINPCLAQAMVDIGEKATAVYELTAKAGLWFNRDWSRPNADRIVDFIKQVKINIEETFKERSDDYMFPIPMLVANDRKFLLDVKKKILAREEVPICLRTAAKPENRKCAGCKACSSKEQIEGNIYRKFDTNVHTVDEVKLRVAQNKTQYVLRTTFEIPQTSQMYCKASIARFGLAKALALAEGDIAVEYFREMNVASDKWYRMNDFEDFTFGEFIADWDLRKFIDPNVLMEMWREAQPDILTTKLVSATINPVSSGAYLSLNDRADLLVIMPAYREFYTAIRDFDRSKVKVAIKAMAAPKFEEQDLTEFISEPLLIQVKDKYVMSIVIPIKYNPAVVLSGMFDKPLKKIYPLCDIKVNNLIRTGTTSCKLCGRLSDMRLRSFENNDTCIECYRKIILSKIEANAK